MAGTPDPRTFLWPTWPLTSTCQLHSLPSTLQKLISSSSRVHVVNIADVGNMVAWRKVSCFCLFVFLYFFRLGLYRMLVRAPEKGNQLRFALRADVWVRDLYHVFCNYVPVEENMGCIQVPFRLCWVSKARIYQSIDCRQGPQALGEPSPKPCWFLLK